MPCRRLSSVRCLWPVASPVSVPVVCAVIERDGLVLIAQRPKIAPFVPQMRERIAAALSVQVEQVNVRGKTAEGLGDLGEGLGMEAHAVCLAEFRITN